MADVQIDFLVREGNESIIAALPFVNRVWVWNKKQGKYRNLLGILKKVRAEKYTRVVNLQRFFTSGLFTVFSRAKYTYGFDKNPLSMFFTQRVGHEIGNGLHETERNQLLIASFTDKVAMRPYLAIPDDAYEKIKAYKHNSFICIAPASVWFTKQFPAHKWFEFISALPNDLQIYIIGGSGDSNVAQYFIEKSPERSIVDLC